MPSGGRRQLRGRGQSGNESAIEVSADDPPSQVMEEQPQVDAMDYEGQVEDDEDEDEEVEGKPPSQHLCGRGTAVANAP